MTEMIIPDKRATLGVAPFIPAPRYTWDRPEYGEPEVSAIGAALGGPWHGGAPILRSVEDQFVRVHAAPTVSHAAISCASGTVGILLVLMALDIGVGDKVVVPGLTWVPGTVGPVLDVGAEPVVLDVDPSTRTLDPDLFERYLADCEAAGEPLPRAVIVVHLDDHAADIDRFSDICAQWGVFLIEDAAQAAGGQWNERALGTFGVAGVFSHEGSKTLACGEGGMVLTGVPMIEMRVRSAASCGREVSGSAIDASAPADELTVFWRDRVERLGLRPWPIQGPNGRMSFTAAALLSAQLGRFPRQQERRVQMLHDARQVLQELPGMRPLSVDKRLTTPFVYTLDVEHDPEAFAGIDASLFQEVCTYLLGGHRVIGHYAPAGGGPAGYRSPGYHPGSLRRYRISDAHMARISSPVELPNSHHAYRAISRIGHPALLEDGFASALGDSITWMYRNAARIADAAGQQPVPGPPDLAARSRIQERRPER
jgi:L-glutamine:2-deoxy-scyllo-inosose/3-amino-2,3-dideoxy-scyllo-inosose aminotransferase